jgi:hypothetical protein
MREQSARRSRFRCGTVVSPHAGTAADVLGGVAAVLWRSVRLLIGGGLEGVEHREAGRGAETVSAACDRDLSYRGRCEGSDLHSGEQALPVSSLLAQDALMVRSGAQGQTGV